ncbi:MAG: hypothetical protein ACT4NV_04605 [Rhodoferax sp.]
MNKPTPEESELLQSFDEGEWRSAAPSRARLGVFRAAATATFAKDRRVNIRMSTPDLMDIQAKALEEGMPYQTLIASVLHKYVSGRLVEAPAPTASPARVRRARV